MKPELPSDPGSYLLWLELTASQTLTVGRLGQHAFPAGHYVYLGSARGPGGIRARLGRHLRGEGKPHWHIDALRTVSTVRGFGYQTWQDDQPAESGSLPAECTWSQALLAISGARLIVPGFGASDCRVGCAAHLTWLGETERDLVCMIKQAIGITVNQLTWS